MAKQTNAQIREQLRNKIAKAYKEKYQQELNSLYKVKQSLQKYNVELHKDCNNLKLQVEELEQKVRAYEDWIERLQCFCDIPDEEREKAVHEYLSKKKVSKEMQRITTMMRPYFKMIMGEI